MFIGEYFPGAAIAAIIQPQTINAFFNQKIIDHFCPLHRKVIGPQVFQLPATPVVNQDSLEWPLGEKIVNDSPANFDIEKLKSSNGADIQVWGSGKLVQLLLRNDLADELRLKIYPLTLGKGKKLFENGTIPAAFTLVDSIVTPGGVIIANYKRAGKVETGTVGAQ